MFFEGPINNLSIGNVSFNFLRELHREVPASVVGFVPVAENFDLTAFNVPNDSGFRGFLDETKDKAISKLTPDENGLRVWHLSGSEHRLTQEQYLYTFYEVDDPTPTEVAIVKNHKHVFFSSSESAQYFKDKGCDNVSFVPLGFDEDFKKKDVPKVKDTVHFSLIGKLEKRKNTQRIIKLWLDKYGNNNDYLLTCLVNNRFFNQDTYNQIIAECLQGKNWTNINFLPFLGTNSEMNDLQNSVDIDLSGLSNGEGWGLPAFNATCLGKWSVVSKCSGHLDWASDTNSILVEPSGKQPCYDGAFFVEGREFNQGSYWKLEDDAILDGIARSLKKVGTENTRGIHLGEHMTYNNSVLQILEKMGE